MLVCPFRGNYYPEAAVANRAKNVIHVSKLRLLEICTKALRTKSTQVEKALWTRCNVSLTSSYLYLTVTNLLALEYFFFLTVLCLQPYKNHKAKRKDLAGNRRPSQLSALAITLKESQIDHL